MGTTVADEIGLSSVRDFAGVRKCRLHLLYCEGSDEYDTWAELTPDQVDELIEALRAYSNRHRPPICAACVRPGERVRGCAQGRDEEPCGRCGTLTAGRLLLAPLP